MALFHQSIAGYITAKYGEVFSLLRMSELADEAYVKHCYVCGKPVKKPFFYRGYVFCSEECRSSFMSKSEKGST